MTVPAQSQIFGDPDFDIASGLESGTPIIIAPNYGGAGGTFGNGAGSFRGKIAPLPRGIPVETQPPGVTDGGIPAASIPRAQAPSWNVLMPFPPRAIVLSQKQLPQVKSGTKPVQFTPAGTASVSTKAASAL